MLRPAALEGPLACRVGGSSADPRPPRCLGTGMAARGSPSTLGSRHLLWRRLRGQVGHLLGCWNCARGKDKRHDRRALVAPAPTLCPQSHAPTGSCPCQSPGPGGCPSLWCYNQARPTLASSCPCCPPTDGTGPPRPPIGCAAGPDGLAVPMELWQLALCNGLPPQPRPTGLRTALSPPAWTLASGCPPRAPGAWPQVTTGLKRSPGAGRGPEATATRPQCAAGKPGSEPPSGGPAWACAGLENTDYCPGPSAEWQPSSLH